MKKISIAFLIMMFVVIVYGHFIETRRITTQTVIIKNNALAGVLEGLTVVHMGDLHFGNGSDPMAAIVLNTLDKIKPEIIFLTGDYVDWFPTNSAYTQANSFLSRLKATYGTFATMGNSDYSLGTGQCLFCHSTRSGTRPRKDDVRFLRNDFVDIKIKNQFLRILGIDTFSSIKPEKKPLDSLSDSLPTIVLSHLSLPFEQIISKKNVLMLSGDTHGGQILLPIWLWKLSTRKPDPQHMYGYFREKNKHLFVTDGIGTSGLDMRIGVPPQIALLRFAKEDESL